MGKLPAYWKMFSGDKSVRDSHLEILLGRHEVYETFFIHPSTTYIVTFSDPVSQNVLVLKVILDILKMNSTISETVLFIEVNHFSLNKREETEVTFFLPMEVYSNTQPQKVCLRLFS